MGPFEFDLERTESSDEIYAAVGRALVLATRFESNCNALALMLDIREMGTSLQSVELPKIVTELNRRLLWKKIEAIKLHVGLGDLGKTTLTSARDARNFIAHELVRGAPDDLRTESGEAYITEQLKEAVHKIANADLLVCILMSMVTHEELPHVNFLGEYSNRIVRWVCEA